MKGLTNPVKNVSIDSKGNPYEYPTLRLPKKEYSKVMHEINTLYYDRFEGKEKSWITISKTTYRFEIHDFDEYNIYYKTKE